MFHAVSVIKKSVHEIWVIFLQCNLLSDEESTELDRMKYLGKPVVVQSGKTFITHQASSLACRDLALEFVLKSLPNSFGRT